MRRLALPIATLGGVGYVPVAPGTAGSAVGLALAVLVRWLGGGVVIELALIGAVTAAGIWAGSFAERHYGGIDPKPVVIDELAGMLITVASLPLTIASGVAGFLLFRLADVIKPYPAGRAERLPGGWGIMGDDILAALYSHAALRVAVAVAPGWFV